MNWTMGTLFAENAIFSQFLHEIVDGLGGSPFPLLERQVHARF